MNSPTASSGFRFPLPADSVLVPSVFVRVAVAKTHRQPTSYLPPSYRKTEVDELANGEFGVQIPVTRSKTEGTSLVLVPSVFVRVAVAKTRRQPTSYLPPSYHKREVDELANGEFGVQIPVTRTSLCIIYKISPIPPQISIL